MLDKPNHPTREQAGTIKFVDIEKNRAHDDTNISKSREKASKKRRRSSSVSSSSSSNERSSRHSSKNKEKRLKIKAKSSKKSKKSKQSSREKTSKGDARASSSRSDDATVSSTTCDAKGLNVIDILKLLVQVRGKAGPIGETVPIILNKVEIFIAKGVVDVGCFNSDDAILLNLVRSQLLQSSEKSTINVVEKMIIQETINQLDQLSKLIQSFLSTSQPLFDIPHLDKVTSRMSMAQSLAHIREVLREFNRPCAEDDVVKIFLDVVKVRGSL